MEIPAEVLRFVIETAEDAVKFDGDEVELAHRARNCDVTAIEELSSAYRAIAVLTALRLRPLWLTAPDAGQEAMLVLDRLVRDGSATIAIDLPLAIRKRSLGSDRQTHPDHLAGPQRHHDATNGLGDVRRGSVTGVTRRDMTSYPLDGR